MDSLLMPSQQANVHKMAINTQLSPWLGNKKASAIHSNSWHSLQRAWVSNARAIYKIWRPLFSFSHTAAAKASHIAVCLISTQRFHPIVAQTTARPQTLAFKEDKMGTSMRSSTLSMEEASSSNKSGYKLHFTQNHDKWFTLISLGKKISHFLQEVT